MSKGEQSPQKMGQKKECARKLAARAAPPGLCAKYSPRTLYCQVVYRLFTKHYCLFLIGVRRHNRRTVTYRGPILTLVAIVIFVGLIAYAIIRGSDEGSSTSVQASSHPPSGSVQATGVGFNSPRDGDTVSNPVQVAMVIGGLKYQKAGEPVTPGYGHLGVIIDGEVTPEGAKFVADATHLDRADASHTATLPTLAPGPHTLSVIFMNSKDVSNGPLVAETIHITVTSASSTP
jgi:hypothetical protein